MIFGTSRCTACNLDVDVTASPGPSIRVQCPSCARELLRAIHAGGCVYFLQNAAMPGLLKIGMTERDPFARAAEISAATGVPEPFIVSAYFPCANPKEVESKIHQLFADQRCKNREFFRVPLDNALREIHAAFNGVISRILVRHGGTYLPFQIHCSPPQGSNEIEAVRRRSLEHDTVCADALKSSPLAEIEAIRQRNFGPNSNHAATAASSLKMGGDHRTVEDDWEGEMMREVVEIHEDLRRRRDRFGDLPKKDFDTRTPRATQPSVGASELLAKRLAEIQETRRRNFAAKDQRCEKGLTAPTRSVQDDEFSLPHEPIESTILLVEDLKEEFQRLSRDERRRKGKSRRESD